MAFRAERERDLPIGRRVDLLRVERLQIGDRSCDLRSSKPLHVLNCRDEGERGDRPNARHTYQPPGDLIAARQLFEAVVELGHLRVDRRQGLEQRVDAACMSGSLRVA